MPTDLLVDAQTHLALAGAALLSALVIALPLGVAAAYARTLRGPLIGIAAVGRTLPSLALLAFMLPVLGVGFVPAVIALTVLAIPPVVINTDLGLRGVPSEAIDAACGLGMTPLQIFWRVAWPQALPAVFAGARTSAIEVVASATLATFIGGGGLGDLIVRGLQTGDATALYAGALTVALLALAVEFIGSALARLNGIRA